MSYRATSSESWRIFPELCGTGNVVPNLTNLANCVCLTFKLRFFRFRNSYGLGSSFQIYSRRYLGSFDHFLSYGWIGFACSWSIVSLPYLVFFLSYLTVRRSFIYRSAFATSYPYPRVPLFLFLLSSMSHRLLLVLFRLGIILRCDPFLPFLSLTSCRRTFGSYVILYRLHWFPSNVSSCVHFFFFFFYIATWNFYVIFRRFLFFRLLFPFPSVPPSMIPLLVNLTFLVWLTFPSLIFLFSMICQSVAFPYVSLRDRFLLILSFIYFTFFLFYLSISIFLVSFLLFSSFPRTDTLSFILPYS